MKKSSLPTRGRSLAALVVAVAAVALLPVLSTSAPAASDNPWTKVEGNSVAARSAKQADIRTTRYAGFTLDRPGMKSTLDKAPPAEGAQTQEVVLPTPEGTFQRFSLVDAPVMEEGLAAAHPEIKTYSGKGIDDSTATVRADLTPLGFHASVRSQRGQWYVDPYFHLDQSLYASYYGHDVSNAVGPLKEKDIVGAARALQPITAGPVVKLRTYRLALVTDPSYANYFGAENVTAAKVTLMNRVNQIYEDETAIRLVLINDTDKTNLNTPALASLPNGPCGAAPCYQPAELEFCDIPTLFATGIVLGQIVGADKYDIGHIGLGLNGGGIAGLGVVGGAEKAVGCTGLPTPVGDFYAVDYVAHEMGHQFAGNHTFNGTQRNCSGENRNGGTSVEPGSGSSIMAYAGICRQDDLQPHSDPYWSQRSFTEITSYITANLPNINEQQDVSFRGFDGTDSFRIGFGSRDSAPIVRGLNYTPEGIKAALEGLRTWPAGATVTVAGFGNQPDYRPIPLDDTGFQITFGGSLAGKNVDSLKVTTRGATAFTGESIKGGAQDNQGWRVRDTDNHAPVVNVPAKFTIPTRTPFALTGDATDADGDTVTYMWEQNDIGRTLGTTLVNNTKTDGPLFRQFGTAAIVSAEDTLKYYSPGENAVNTNPTRVFPDLAQIAVNNTNARTGGCPVAPPSPAPVPADLLDCYSEFLPTGDWVGFDDRTLHFRLTARDGRPGAGGVSSADTALVLAPAAGPFLVTSQGSAAVVNGGSTQPITWDVAGTSAAPIGADNVKISFSTDGGLTFPHVLSQSTPNDGNEKLVVPDVATTKGRVKIEAVGNIFFDLNDADITVHASPRVTNSGEATVQYSDAMVPVTITANDPDSAGSGLTAAAAGLPAGLSLVAGPAADSTRTWTVSGTTTAAPGDYPVSVTVTDDTGVAGGTTFSIKVKPEDAQATYTGDSLVYGDSVQLRATVQDNSDAVAGDVRTGTVSFEAGGKTLCTAALGLLGTASTDASGSCSAKLPAGVHDVTVSVGGNYTGTAKSRVETAKSQTRVVLGAGVLTAAHSAGAYPADQGSKIDFSLLLAHARSNTSGLASVTLQSGGKRYQVLGTKFDSFGAKTSGQLDLRGRVALFDITDWRHPVRVADGLTLRVTATGGQAAITLLQGEKLLLSSNWTGAKTQEIPLTSGRILIG